MAQLPENVFNELDFDDDESVPSFDRELQRVIMESLLADELLRKSELPEDVSELSLSPHKIVSTARDVSANASGLRSFDGSATGAELAKSVNSGNAAMEKKRHSEHDKQINIEKKYYAETERELKAKMDKKYDADRERKMDFEHSENLLDVEIPDVGEHPIYRNFESSFSDEASSNQDLRYHSANFNMGSATREMNLASTAQDLDLELLRAIENSAKESVEARRKAFDRSPSPFSLAFRPIVPPSPASSHQNFLASSPQRPTPSYLPTYQTGLHSVSNDNDNVVTPEMLFDLAFSKESPGDHQDPLLQEQLPGHGHERTFQRAYLKDRERAHKHENDRKKEQEKALRLAREEQLRYEQYKNSLTEIASLLDEGQKKLSEGRNLIQILFDFQKVLGILDEKLKFLNWLNNQLASTTRAKVREQLSEELKTQFEKNKSIMTNKLEFVVKFNQELQRIQTKVEQYSSEMIVNNGDVRALIDLQDPIRRMKDELSRRTSFIDTFIRTFVVPCAEPGTSVSDSPHSKLEGTRVVKSDAVIFQENEKLKRMHDDYFRQYQLELKRQAEEERRKKMEQQRIVRQNAEQLSVGQQGPAILPQQQLARQQTEAVRTGPGQYAGSAPLEQGAGQREQLHSNHAQHQQLGRQQPHRGQQHPGQSQRSKWSSGYLLGYGPRA